MDRKTLEIALVELDGLLAEHETPEADLQAWFERHPVIFDAYGLKRALPHPQLHAPDGLLIPDFLVQRVDDLWEVVELKRKDVPVLRDNPRQTFYAKFEQYYVQCRSYSRFFQQDSLRQQFNAETGLGVQPDVQAMVIAGRRADVDLSAVNTLLADRGCRVALQTYDDVRAQLEFFRKKFYGADELLDGLYVSMFFIPEKLVGRDNYIFDIGVELHRNRVSIAITTQDELAVRAVSSDGKHYAATIPLEKAQVLYGLPTYLLMQIGFSESHTVLNVEINGEHFFDRRLDAFHLEPEPTRNLVLGSSVDGTEHTNMSVIEWSIGSKTMSFDDRWGLAAYFANKYARCFQEPGWFPPRVIFEGHQFLYTRDHPNFTSAG